MTPPTVTEPFNRGYLDVCIPSDPAEVYVYFEIQAPETTPSTATEPSDWILLWMRKRAYL